MADASNRPSDEQLFSKKASFVQHSLPGLEAGVYELQVTQSFEKSDGTPINEENLPTVSKTFGVQGPKYSIPKEAINTQYPPIAAAGGFSNSVAHVVLNKVKLPWIRSPYLPGNEPAIEERHYRTSYGGSEHDITYDDDKATWMAVLLISPSDIDGADPKSLMTSGTAKDLVPSKYTVKTDTGTAPQGALPNSAYSIFSYTLEDGLAPKDNTVDPGVGHTPDEDCIYIDIPVSLFNVISPSIDDLQMMAHVRSVEMDTKPIQDGDTVQSSESYSLVVGNRLPETMPATTIPPTPQTAPALGNNMAFLVSLEHMQNALRGYPTGGYFAKNIASAPEGFVRLPVFFKWSFVSWQDSSFDFEFILKGLNGRDATALNSGPPVDNPLFRRPNPPSYDPPTQVQTLVQEMVELGYTPMNHLTRVPYVTASTSDPIQTVSWFRGPFAPFDVKTKVNFLSGSASDPADQTPLVYSADQLLRFDPNAGLYDTSYAAAWQIGQLVSLQDQSFSTALYRWKISTEHKYRMMLEDAVLQDNYSGLVSSFRTLAADGSDEKIIYKGMMNFLVNKSQD